MCGFIFGYIIGVMFSEDIKKLLTELIISLIFWAIVSTIYTYYVCYCYEQEYLLHISNCENVPIYHLKNTFECIKDGVNIHLKYHEYKTECKNF